LKNISLVIIGKNEAQKLVKTFKSIKSEQFKEVFISIPQVLIIL